MVTYDTHSTSRLFGYPSVNKDCRQKRIIITLLNIDDVTLFDIHSLLFLKDIENLQKNLVMRNHELP